MAHPVEPAQAADFSPLEKHAVYKAIAARRDVRRFLPSAVPEEVVEQVLLAAHHAPSVGFMQPWNFILIRDPERKKRIKEAFLRARSREAEQFSGARKELYLGFKLEGIEEAPINICVTCDSTRHGPAVLGRSHVPETDVYSTCCAIQNLWLAARVEGLGMGWVSLLSRDELKRILQIPSHVTPIAYLCLGYTSSFETRPELETAGWLTRMPLKEAICQETWDRTDKG